MFTLTLSMVTLISLALVYTSEDNVYPVSVNITQDNLPVRPQGDVTLTCILSGVPSNEVEYYWWLIDETNSPIFIFSEVYQIAEVTEEYKTWVKYETHTITDYGIVSTLRINANVSKTITLRCEFNMKDSRIYSSLSKIKFAGPAIHIYIDENTSNRSREYPVAVADVFCFVNTAIGYPNFSLSLHSQTEERGTYTESTTVTHYNDQVVFHGIHHAVMALPAAGDISCTVDDDLGTYIVARSIKLKDESCQHIRKSGTITICFIASVALNVVTFISIAFYCCIAVANRTNNNVQSSGGLPQDRLLLEQTSGV